MFSEMGPFSVDSDGKTLLPREYTWNQNQGMIFIDNPVGTGYSYTETETGYCTNTKQQVSSQLFELMQQFYQVFPDQAKNELYITGESYAGHYVPGLAFKIHAENIKGEAKVYVPLAGLAIGDGWVDPYSQLAAYPDMLFDIGVADLNEKAKFEEYVTLARHYIEEGEYYDSFTVWDEMINGDVYPYPNYYHNVTGSNDYDNFMDTNSPSSLYWYRSFVSADSTRKAIHVGDAVYNSYGRDTELNLLNDFMVSFKDEMQLLMDNYKTLIYSGQLDVIIGAALTQKMIPTFKWKGKDEFTRAQKSVWRITSSDSEVAGYVKQAGLVTQAVVRGAGHLVPFDQPARALSMIEKWINDEKFLNEINPTSATGVDNDL
jgi:vitellogenic carboxypeptidase-like protein